jgi:hypothetical protein
MTPPAMAPAWEVCTASCLWWAVRREDVERSGATHDTGEGPGEDTGPGPDVGVGVDVGTENGVPKDVDGTASRLAAVAEPPTSVAVVERNPDLLNPSHTDTTA